MRIVTVADEAESAQLCHVLRAGGHTVVEARGEPDMISAINTHSAQLVVLGAGAPVATVAALARAVGTTAARPHTLLIHGGVSDDYVAQIIEAGADGDVRKPLSPRYFAARLAAVKRRTEDQRGAAARPAESLSRTVDPAVRAAESTPRAPEKKSADVPAAAPGSAPGRSSPVVLVSRSAVWGSVLERLREVASRFLTMDVRRSELPQGFEPEGLGASILLLGAASELETRIAIAVDAQSASSLAMHLFGDHDAGLAQEVLNELTNIFMGTLKTAFSNENIVFTGGLPQAAPVGGVLRPPMPFRFQETALLEAGDARIVVAVGLRSRANVLVVAGELREGMVLAKDVANARGMLLLNGGTRLSAHMVERLRANVAARQEIEVMAP